MKALSALRFGIGPENSRFLTEVKVNDIRDRERLRLMYEAAVREHRQRKLRRPTLASVSKQANKAAIPVARYEVKPDGSITVVTGQPESATESNPWFDDLKVTKQ
jgi:hypothetical protein